MVQNAKMNFMTHKKATCTLLTVLAHSHSYTRTPFAHMCVYMYKSFSKLLSRAAVTHHTRGKAKSPAANNVP